MKLSDTKLGQALRHWQEFKGSHGLDKFATYLDTPYLQADRQLPAFYRHFRHGLMEGLDGKSVYQAAFPHRTFSSSHLRERMSVLLGRLVDFMALEDYLEDTQSQELHLVWSLSRQGNYRQLTHLLDRSLEQGYALSFPNDTQLHHLLRLEHQRTAYFMKHGPRDGSVSFGNLHDLLDRYYWIRKLNYARITLTYQQDHGGPDPLPAMQPFLDFLESMGQDLHPQIRCYWLAFKMTSNPEDSHHFMELQSWLLKIHKDLPPAVAWDLFNPALNYCMRLLNSGRLDMLSNTASLYTLFFDRVVKPSNLKVPQALFKNYINVLVSSGDLDRAQSAFAAFSGHILGQTTEQGFQFARALVHFASGEYPDARRILNHLLVGNLDVFFSIGARAYLWIMDYLEKDWEAFESRYHMFRTFVQAKKAVSPVIKTNFIQFSKAMKKLGAIREVEELGKSKLAIKKRTELRSWVEREPNLIHRHWLLSQLSSS